MDGGCRRNGQNDAIGAAAAVLYSYGSPDIKTLNLPRTLRPANQRAEITSIVIALEWAMGKYEMLRSNLYVDVLIHSGSSYAVNCFREWKAEWIENGFRNYEGHPGANQDLIMKVIDLEESLMSKNCKVDYTPGFLIKGIHPT